MRLDEEEEERGCRGELTLRDMSTSETLRVSKMSSIALFLVSVNNEEEEARLGKKTRRVRIRMKTDNHAHCTIDETYKKHIK